MKKKFKDFDELLAKELKDPEFAASYLNEHLSFHGENRQELILEALYQIAQARGFTDLARRSGMSRRTLYHAFSKSGNPTIDTFLALLDSIGVSMKFAASSYRPRKRVIARRPKTAA